MGVDRAIARLAERQHGTVARRQLLMLGLTARQISRRVRAGRLHPLHRGVYAVGHRRLTRRGRWMAAVLAAAPGAVLSHRAAAALHGIRDHGGREIEITAPARVARPGLKTYEACLSDDEITVVHGIPVTTLARTLLDLAAVVSERQVERALGEVERRGGVPALRALLERHPTAKGSGHLRRLCEQRRLDATLTRSELEEAFLAYVRRHRLRPEPELNALVLAGTHTVECDAVWRAARIVVELDSREYHAHDAAFATDRLKSRRLTVAGWHPIRVAPEHLRTAELAQDLRNLIARVA